MSVSKQKSPIPSPPLIIPALQAHKSTFIILHGRGSTAEKFSKPLLQHAVPSLDSETHASSAVDGKTFQDHFPNTKFVFPTAPLRRAVVFKRSLTHQWFDNWSLTQPELKQHLQVQGLRETSIYLHELLRDEIKIVGAANVVLIGLSQGCAASIVALLLWQGEPIGGLVGMCGYLPFRKGMQSCFDEAGCGDDDSLVGSGGDGEDMFERNDDDDDFVEKSKFDKAMEWLREELQTGVDYAGRGSESPSMQAIPVFMGHGKDDEKVPIAFGKLAADFLGSIDVDVTWKEYEGLGHWYSEDMLQDVVGFLKEKRGWSPPS
ncbi:phospholipase/carboxylesterase family protein-like protein [Plenodomus tracheiphilus IPT5]|uniref:Phospholipase/carboxylesterase family protein-like protein n=1 Tax=Plenodomus tracheiphilus IPT5 TaxID=1408161 RepID=A0A6A7BE38_9PLEO|nr:phospholipase/carboxylesterase family protein-like protein [Plenodomus tracheiphilus IPT5]